MTGEDFEKTVKAFMDQFTTMTLACSMNDRPWAAPVYYARRNYDLIFFSSPTCRHSTTLAENPKASAAIYGSYNDWESIKGLQMEGTVESIQSPVAIAKALATYVKRHSFVKELLKDPLTLAGEILGKTSRVQLYMFRPDRIRYLDNSVGFGVRWMQEILNGEPFGEPVLDQRGVY
jgi:uncharacterized protein YhbP (UPF0306 family)